MLELESDLTLSSYIKQCDALTSAERVKQENDRYWGVEGGYYCNYIEAWLNEFEGSVQVLFFDDLQNDSQTFLEKTCRWLDIDSEFISTLDLSIQNKSVSYKNAGIQKLALSVNSRAEKFWRANQRAKDLLRRIYYTFNGEPHKGKVDKYTLEKVREIYRPYNQQLAKQLSSRGYESLPTWLQEK